MYRNRGGVMTKQERQMAKIHAQRGAIEKKVRQARDIIQEWLRRCRRPYIAFSGGKDSLVVLHLVRQEASVEALFGDDEHLYPGTEDMLADTNGVTRLCGPSRHCDWYTSWADAGPSSIPKDAQWVDSVPWQGSVVTYAREQGYDGAVIGLRKQESGTRALHVQAEGALFFAESKELWHCYPIADWSAQDVWAYIASRDLSYHSAYDVMAEKGVPMGRRRVGPFAPRGAVSAALPVIRQCFPDAFREFAHDYPEAARYV